MQLGRGGQQEAGLLTSPAEIKKSLSHFIEHLPGLEYCVQVWSQLYKKDVDWLDRLQKEATKMSKGGGSQIDVWERAERTWFVQP